MSAIPIKNVQTSSQLLDELYKSVHMPVTERQELVFTAILQEQLASQHNKRKKKAEEGVMYVGSAKAKKR